MQTQHWILIVGAIGIIAVGFYIGKKTVEAVQQNNPGPPTKSLDDLVKSLSLNIVPNSLGAQPGGLA